MKALVINSYQTYERGLMRFGSQIQVYTIFCFVIFIVIFQALTAQAKELRGKVYILGWHDELIPVKNTTVRIEETDDTDVTTDTGAFRLFLPDIFRAGETVSLRVDKSGYQVLHPFGGRVRIPADPLKDPVEVRLDLLGSHRFLSKKNFALLIEKIANETKKQVKATDSRQEIDLSRYLKDWAVKYGFGIEEVRAALDQWATEVEADQEDFYELGLAAFYKKNFSEAAEKFTQSAKNNEQKLATLREKEYELKQKVIRDYRLAGDSHYNNYRFQNALSAYRKALAEMDMNATPRSWASLMIDTGNTYSNLGIRAKGQDAQQYLAKAVDNYHFVLQVYTRKELPQQWAMTQNNLGTALSEQGIRTGGEQGRALLAQAVAAYQAALEVYTRKELPQQWAMTQNNLGIALKEQAMMAVNGRKKQLFGRAVAAFRNALEIQTYEHFPPQWAQTQNNLAETYYAMEDWPNAAECYVNVLKVYTAYETAYQRASFIYHEHLFEFEKAYELYFIWVITLGNFDLSSVSNFIEKHFTTGRFAEAEKLLSFILAELKPDHPLFPPLCAIEIANLLALNKADAVPAKLDILMAALQQQSNDYTFGWNFNGTKHFINVSDELASYRDWLLSFFAAIEGKNKESIFKRLRPVQEAFKNVIHPDSPL